jgi:hypothetical protein
MLTSEERTTAHRMAGSIIEAHWSDNDSLRRLLAAALIESAARESAYQARIAELQDSLASVTASGVANATRYAADLAAERRAGADAVERIREAIAAGACAVEQAWAHREALENVEESARPGTLRRLSAAYLALSESHAEARATLRDIGEQALRLLGKGT